MEKKNKIKGKIDYQAQINIIDNELRQFALLQGVEYTDMKKTDEAEYYSTKLSFRGFDVCFVFGVSIMAGYSFMEMDEASDEYCLLSRFKFNFSDTYFSPYDIHNVLRDKDFRTLDFHCLISDDDIKKAVETLTAFISRHFSELSALADNYEQSRQLVDNYNSDRQLVSKKITDDKLNSDFLKYTTKHELNLYFYHIENQDKFNSLAMKGKKSDLERFLSKKSAKNQLTVFEKRYMDYLIKMILKSLLRIKPTF